MRENHTWRLELKPVTPQSDFGLAGIHQLGIEGASAPPPKCQLQYLDKYLSGESANTSATTPSTNTSPASGAKSPAAPAPKKEDRSPVKPPPPDIFIGMTSTLSPPLSPRRILTRNWPRNSAAGPDADGAARARRATRTCTDPRTRPTRLRSRLPICCSYNLRIHTSL
jgi:hypothetical protein